MMMLLHLQQPKIIIIIIFEHITLLSEAFISVFNVFLGVCVVYICLRLHNLKLLLLLSKLWL